MMPRNFKQQIEDQCSFEHKTQIILLLLANKVNKLKFTEFLYRTDFFNRSIIINNFSNHTHLLCDYFRIITIDHTKINKYHFYESLQSNKKKKKNKE